MVDGFGKESTTGIQLFRLIPYPSKQVLVGERREEEETGSETVDDGGNDHVARDNDCVDGDTGKDCSPLILG